ncbi:MAG TPA: Ig-like domain-containing protein [Gemmatimonadales bacterium]|jgi:hypothetical protein|nr:Ig-like domain-containing protein [Gemmatimonadales bacterium]
MHRARIAALLFLIVLPVAASAQRGAPLLKTDLIDLLSSPVIPHQEIADLVRRNCLAFRPTDRDWTDFRSLGAAPDVVASITGCASGRFPVAGGGATAAAPLGAAPVTATSLQVMLRQPRIQAAAGSQARIVVLAARGGLPQPGAQLMLRGSAAIDGGSGGSGASGRDMVVATDDSGFAVFAVRVGRRLASYRLEIAPAAGGTFPGRPVVEVIVRSGPPATAIAEPREILFDTGLDSLVPVAVTVRDSIGHPVRGEPVVFRGTTAEMGFVPDTAVTDSLGRVRMVVARSAIRRKGTIQVQVRDKPMAAFDIVIGMPLGDGETDFLPIKIASGSAGNGLGEPVVFQARTRLGRPAVGRTVMFRAVNATLMPSTVVTDSLGRARVEVTLGERVGPATLWATVDSVEKHVNLQVDPGPAVELVLEHNGFRVNGRWVGVGLDTVFVVRFRMLDAFGNSTDVAGLARMLRATPINKQIPIVRVVSVEEEPTAVALTLKAIQTGRASVKLRTADISAAFLVEVVDVRR